MGIKIRETAFRWHLNLISIACFHYLFQKTLINYLGFHLFYGFCNPDKWRSSNKVEHINILLAGYKRLTIRSKYIHWSVITGFSCTLNQCLSFHAFFHFNSVWFVCSKPTQKCLKTNTPLKGPEQIKGIGTKFYDESKTLTHK